MRASSSFQPTRRAFLGAVLAFGVSGEAMALTPAQRLVRAARRQVGVTLTYDPAYSVLRFPNGDVDRAKGVCTDVVIRAFRDALGVDLQALVNTDMRANFGAYPKNWGLGRPDRNIDHRRVPNLATFWRRQGAAVPVTDDPADWRPGDIFTQMVGGRMPHTGIVSDRKDTTGVPLVLHNIGGGTREEDALFDHPLTGHFRWKV
ncbi:DUF1287 domain-containing protein [Sphingopyxis sp. PAMC25046]|uniref:DUF1287 domain-containing protein n=1 Tax=Sphingopyxis sp. PAMC25046 TaxID=2565556 RepID=UPI00109DEC92|nr:DUF1287 domain-containing protein [Sphingopyxis sp. PAMC25046]QCB53474.1 DUF1287 domain-containing protein [Sphingopyxis sp. PAMC25046]